MAFGSNKINNRYQMDEKTKGKKTKMKQTFKDLIQNLRKKTNFRDKQQFNEPIEQIVPPHPNKDHPHINDILPITQFVSHQAKKGIKSEMGSEGHLNPEDNRSEIIKKFMEGRHETSRLLYFDDHTEIEKLKQEQEEKYMPFRGNRLLKPQQKLSLQRNEGRVGGIKRQVVNNKPIISQKKQPSFQKMKYIKQSYTKIHPILEPQQLLANPKMQIKLIDDIQIIKYWNKSIKLNESSSYEQIHTFFDGIIDQMNLEVIEPIIKKYKNCVYFGCRPAENIVYQGFIYFFHNKIYYGEFVNGVKHGYGKEIDFKNNTKFSGNFKEGKKIGYFSVQKERENYEGFVNHGIYHGQGKLMTEDYVYTGMFENGKKHGIGQQYFPKTGLKLKGCFKNGQYQNLNKSQLPPDPTSDKQLTNKIDSQLTKSNSYAINFQFNKKISEKYFSSSLSKQQQSSKKDAVQDSKSLFDMITNAKKTNKYDIYVENIAKRLPKILVDGILNKDRSPKREATVSNRKREMYSEESRLTNLQYASQHKKSIQMTKTSVQAMEGEQPLTRRIPRSPLKSGKL